MDKERIKIITLASDPETPEDRITAGLEALKSDKGIPKPKPSGFLDEKGARAFCGGVSRSTFWLWRKNGLPEHKIGGRILFDPDELRNYIMN